MMMNVYDRALKIRHPRSAVTPTVSNVPAEV